MVTLKGMNVPYSTTRNILLGSPIVSETREEAKYWLSEEGLRADIYDPNFNPGDNFLQVIAVLSATGHDSCILTRPSGRKFENYDYRELLQTLE